MSAVPSRDDRRRPGSESGSLRREMAPLRARRRDARRRRANARLDLALGAFVALLLLLFAPGLAIVALVAFAIIALCLLSVAVERWRRRRGRVRAPRRRGQRATPGRTSRPGERHM
jgi:Flp pilus assembly protein TadB